MDVLIVTATGSAELLEACLRSLQTTGTDLPLGVTVVDNASADGLVDAVRSRHPHVTVHALATNGGFAAGVNHGLRATSGDLVLLLNPDTEVLPGAIDKLADVLAADPRAGLAGPRLVDPGGRPDHNAKRSFPTPSAALRHFLGRGGSGYAATDVPEDARATVDALSGSCMLARRSAIEEVGLLDPGYWMYGEDLDWCRRFQQVGWRSIYVGDATIVHVKHGVSGQRRGPRLNWAFHRAMGRFYRKFESGRRPWLDVLVYAGILAKYLASEATGRCRRLPRSGA